MKTVETENLEKLSSSTGNLFYCNRNIEIQVGGGGVINLEIQFKRAVIF
jgi:hypothetical protein